MQTVFLVSVIFGLLIQRSLARLLEDRCGLAVAGKITNGRNAESEAAAWMAAIRNETDFLCGGTLIHKRFVLTAAHCIEGQGRLFVRLGTYNLSLHAVEYGVSHAEVHREYYNETFQHDIGLLKLPLDVVFTEQIYPICINLPPTTQTGAEGASTFDAYGWGKTLTTNISKILQTVTLHRYDRSRCNNIFYRPLTSNQICAGSSKSDTCLGDSGGPLIKELNYNGIRRLTQLGIISYGLKTCDGIAIYTDVARYSDWIEERIKALIPQDSSLELQAPSKTVAFGVVKFDGAELLVEPCGTAVSARIMDGSNAEPEAGAWMAAVYSRTHLICGGTVIHRRFVLTSAGCAFFYNDLFVKLGANDLRHPTLEFNVTKKIMHDKFDQQKRTNDIALLQLSGDIPFSRSIYPICIILNPEVKSKVENAYTFDAYGWGRKSKNGDLNHLLQKVTLDRYNSSVCLDTFGILSGDICAGASVGGPCHGDAGGPLTESFFVNGLQRQTQLGVISRGTPTCNGMGIYTDVTSYVDWIVRNVRGYA